MVFPSLGFQSYSTNRSSQVRCVEGNSVEIVISEGVLSGGWRIVRRMRVVLMTPAVVVEIRDQQEQYVERVYLQPQNGYILTGCKSVLAAEISGMFQYSRPANEIYLNYLSRPNLLAVAQRSPLLAQGVQNRKTCKGRRHVGELHDLHGGHRLSEL